MANATAAALAATLAAVCALAGCEGGAGFVPPAQTVALDPPSGRQGTDQVVIARGTGTRFLGHRESVSGRFENGVASVVGAMRVETDERIRMLVSIPGDAPEGPATMVLSVGPDRFDLSFTILPVPVEASARFEPDEVPAGFEGTIDLVGSGTWFAAGVTAVAFQESSGIRVTALDPVRPDLARVSIAVPATAVEGSYPASVATGAQILSTSLRVNAGTGPRVEFDPHEGVQGSDLTVDVWGHGIAFDPADVTIEFPFNRGVVVPPSSVTVLSPPGATESHLAARLDVAEDALIGTTTGWVRSAGVEATGAFTVSRAGEAPSVRFSPSAVHAGDSGTPVWAFGRRTSFVALTTEGASSRPDVAVDAVVVYGPTTALLLVSVDETDVGDAEFVEITLRTGAESVSGIASVLPAPPAAMTITPDVLEHPTGADGSREVAVTVRGVDLRTATRLEPEAGSGIAVRSLVARDATTGTAALRVSRDAPYGPSTLRLVAPEGTLSADVVVVAAADDSVSIEPGYLLADGVSRSFTTRSTAPSFRSAGVSWPSLLRPDTAGIETEAPEILSDSTLSFLAAPSPAVAAGHVTVGIHGSDAGAGGAARHLAVRATAAPIGPQAAVLGPGSVRAGETLVTIARSDRSPFVAGSTALSVPDESGLSVTARVTGPEAASLRIEAKQTALPGARALLFHTPGETVPAVLEVLPPASLPALTQLGDAVGPDSTALVSLTGTGTHWSSETDATVPAGDPDIAAASVADADGSSAAVEIRTAASLLRPGAHTLFLETGPEVAAGLVWIGSSPPAPLTVSPGWLHAGVDGRVVVTSTSPVLADASAHGVEGVDVTSVESLGGTALALGLRPTGPGNSSAVLELAIPGGPVTLVVPILKSPPLATPEGIALARSPAMRQISLRVEGLDPAMELAARPSGSDLWAGRASVDAGGTVTANVVLGVGADASEDRWLVLAGETAAVAVRIDVGGNPAAQLAAGEQETVTVAPSLPAIRSLPLGDKADTARVSCADPDVATVTVTASDGASVLLSSPASEPLPHVLPSPAAAGPAAFLVVESTAPTTCTLWHGTWWSATGPGEFERPDGPGSNDDPGSEELVVPPTPGAALAWRAEFSAGYDIDRFIVDMARPAVVEVVTGLPAGIPMRPETILEVTGPGGFSATVDWWDASAGGVASVLASTPGRYQVTVRPVSGTGGPYVLSVRSPVVIEEVDAWTGPGMFVELSGPPGTSAAAYTLEQRSSTGAVLGRVSLAGLSIPSNGLLVMASSSAVPGFDAVWTHLAALASPTVLAVIAPDGRDADRLAIGAGPGEGAPSIVPSPATSLGRCLHVDTDSNVADFWKQAAPTPGEPNVCDRR